MKFNDRYPHDDYESLHGGGMAQLYKVYDRLLQRYVVLKSIHEKHIENNKAHQRFDREVALLQLLGNHAHIPTLYDTGRHPEKNDTGRVIEWPYYTMEFVGSSADQFMEEMRRPFTLGEVLQIMHDILPTLDFIHSEGIFHRDIKPGNILIRSRLTPERELIIEKAYLADFGISTMPDEKEVGSPITQLEDRILGTRGYIAREVIDGQPSSAVSDLYGIGVTIYELLTGTPMGRARYDEPELFWQDIPTPFAVVILKATKDNPHERYQTGAALHHALEDALKDTKAFDNMPLPDRPVGGSGTTQGSQASSYGWGNGIFGVPSPQSSQQRNIVMVIGVLIVVLMGLLALVQIMGGGQDTITLPTEILPTHAATFTPNESIPIIRTQDLNTLPTVAPLSTEIQNFSPTFTPDTLVSTQISTQNFDDGLSLTATQNFDLSNSSQEPDFAATDRALTATISANVATPTVTSP